MVKRKVTAQSFLKNMALDDAPALPADARAKSGRAGLKHIGGYFERETVEQVAILRARLDLDNSQLIKRAIEDLFKRETAAKKFGDR